MKKILVLCLMMLPFLGDVVAQNLPETEDYNLFSTAGRRWERRKSELKIGVGLYGYNQLLSAIGDGLNSLFNQGLAFDVNVESKGEYKPISPYISYMYHSSRFVSLGLTLAFDHNELTVGRFTDNGSTRTREEGNSYTRYFYTLALEGQFNYVRQEAYTMYSAFGVGAVLMDYKEHDHNLKVDSKIYPTFQLTLIGASFGSNVGAFGEFGYGYKGFLNAGLFIKF
ncbi:MAG: hypothetical protein LBR66_04640 [Candidatus Symbiothrix sp.]|jgi:hypothetical protein|nr:hypothetical protein [Candidatus Symbiothrix sp.]